MSILGDGLMGALDVGRSYLQADIKAEAKSKEADEAAARQEATDIRRDDMAQKRAIATEQLKEEFSRSQSESKYKRLQSEVEAIDKEASNIDFKRSGGLINSIRNSVPNEGEFASKELSAEDIATIRTKMTPADAEKFYGLKPQTALSVTDDQIAAAKNVGAYESRPALIEQRKTLFETDKAERSERQKADELKRKTAKDESDATHKERIADAKDEQNRIMMAKVSGALAKVGSKESNTDFDKKVKLLREAGASPQEISNFITEKKQPSVQDLAASFMKADPYNMTPEQSVVKARELQKLTAGKDDPAKPAEKPNAPVSKAEYDKLPKGSVFTAPDGSRRIKP
jgi:hypothetical protein